MGRVIGSNTSLLNLESIVGRVGEILGDSPGERSTSGSADRTDSVKVLRRTPAEDEGGRGLVLGGVGDGVGLASYNTAGWVVVDLNREGSGEEGSARKNDLEETHVDGVVSVVVIRYVLIGI